MTQAQRGREGEAAREEERSEERQLLGVVAHNTMMGLYYPNVLSVSVYPPRFSTSACLVAGAALSQSVKY